MDNLLLEGKVWEAPASPAFALAHIAGGMPQKEQLHSRKRVCSLQLLLCPDRVKSRGSRGNQEEVYF